MADIFELAEELRQTYHQKLPPVDQWDPPLSGDIDMRIARDGKWYHEGDEIQRFTLVKLFSSILKREGDDYFLVTPVEKWRLQVDDAPFLVVALEQHPAATDHKPTAPDQQVLTLTTLTEDKVVVDKDHPIWVLEREAESGEPEPAPYVMVRNNMPALIGRNVYYELIDLALMQTDQSDKEAVIHSAGEVFSLVPQKQ